MTRAPHLGTAFVMFVLMLAHAMLETARDALFLARLGASQLPWAYLAIAAASIAILFAARRLTRDRDPRSLLIKFLVGSSVGTALLGAGVHALPSVTFLLYVWTGIVAALVVPTFWLLVDRQHQIGDARRAFARIAAAGSGGALVGALAAAAIGVFSDPAFIVYTAAGVLAIASRATSMLPVAALSTPQRRRARTQQASALHSATYVRTLLALALATTIALTLADFLFKRVLAENLVGASLTAGFGVVYAGLNVLGLVIQLAVTPRLLERLGVGGAMTLLPVLVLATLLGFVVSGAAIAVIALKLTDGALRHSVHRVASEILFLPISNTIRESAKHLIEVIGQRGGQVLAAGLVLLVADDKSVLLLFTAAAVTVWLVLVVMARRGYVQQLRDRLDAGDIQRTGAIPALDAESVALLTASLSSPDEAEALAALDLLAPRGDRIPALVLYHPSTAVVRKALSLLDGDARRDIVRVLARLTEHADPTIRASALAASSRTGCNHKHLVAALDDAEPEVRAAAAVSLSTKPCGAAGLAKAKLRAMIAGSVEERLALARAIGRAPDVAYRNELVELIAHPEHVVVRQVLRVWADRPDLADVDRLLALLDDPHVRREAREVFTAGGPALFTRLVEALEDPRTPLAVRRHLPRTISRFRGAEAATALSARLLREPDGTTEFKILRALGRMRADDPTLAVDADVIRRYVERSIGDADRYATLAASLRFESGGATIKLLRELLDEKNAHAIERVFRALAVLYPTAELQTVHHGMTSDSEELRAAGREVLDHVLPVRLRSLLSVLDRPVQIKYVNDADILAALLRDPSDSLRCIAAHHVAEARIVALRHELVRLKSVTAAPLVTYAFEQAIARLDA